MSPKNDIFETNVGKYMYACVLKPFLVAFGHLFPIKRGRGCLLERGVFIRINMVIICTAFRMFTLPLLVFQTFQ